MERLDRSEYNFFFLFLGGGVGVTLVLKWRNVVISTQMNQIKLIQLILSLQSSFARAATLDRLQTPNYRL